MRRGLKSTQGGLLERAFPALGPGPTRRELELVAGSLRESGDDAAIAALYAAATNHGEWEALIELANASGSNGFVALDLRTEFLHPGSQVRGREG